VLTLLILWNLCLNKVWRINSYNKGVWFRITWIKPFDLNVFLDCLALAYPCLHNRCCLMWFLCGLQEYLSLWYQFAKDSQTCCLFFLYMP
jgi:hypothetical protein